MSKYDTITGYTNTQVATVCEYPPTHRWIFRGSARRRRMRIILSLVWYYDMIPDEWYTTEEVKNLCLSHDARGTSAMIISNVRVGTLLRVLIAKDLIEYRVVRGKREYRKGEINENEMQQL